MSHLLRTFVGAVLAVAACHRAALAQSPSFASGLSDRGSLQTWIESLGPEARAGADYWSGQRSLSTPGSCFSPARSAQFSNGCTAAQARFGPTDARRRADSDYRAGWNSYSTVSAVQPPSSSIPGREEVVERLRETATRDCRVAVPRYRTLDAYGRPIIQTMELPPDVKAQADDCERRKQDAIRALPAAQQAVSEARAEEDRRRREIQQAEQRAREEEQQRAEQARRTAAAADARQARLLVEQAQAIAEESAENHCKSQDTARVVIENFNRFKQMQRLDQTVLDITHITTDRNDTKTGSLVCHGTFLMSGGQEIPGSFEIRRNVAGNLIYLWSPDSADGGQAHARALADGPMRDIRSISGDETASRGRLKDFSRAVDDD